MSSELHDKIKDGFVLEIENLLSNEDEEENGHPLTNDKIMEFIRKHDDNINKMTTCMINAYEEDGELSELTNPELDWFREFISDEFYNIINKARQA